MSVLGDSTVGLYAFPIIWASALGAMFHLNYANDKWYNPRLALIGLPAAGVMVYIFGKFSLVLSMHYAVSSWFTVMLFSMQRWEKARNALDLPQVFRPAPAVPLPSLVRKLPSPAQQQLVEEELLIEEPMIDLRSEEEIVDPAAAEQPTPYKPIFKIGPTATTTTAAKPLEIVSEGGETGSDNAYVAPPKGGGFMSIVKQYEKGSRVTERFRHWRLRQRLARHGKKGKLKEFIDEAPVEQNFLRDPVKLTAEVTPGLKRYVKRRQYPTDTTEQNERKISYIERTQSQRW
eukprot:sb/3467680/